MKYGNISPRKMDKILTSNGWSFDRRTGSHAVYRKGGETMSVPMVTLKPVIAQRLIKQYELAI